MNTVDYKDIKAVVKHLGVTKQFKKNEYIFQINDMANDIYLLVNGWVKIAQDGGDGHGVTLSLHKEGNMFGLAEPFANIPQRTKDARCLTNCQIIALDVQTLFQLVNHHPELLISITTTLSQNILHTQNLVGLLMNKPIQWRLASLLIDFSDKKDDSLFVNFPITHEEISFLIGCSRQTVTEILNKWRAQQFIDYNRQKVVIYDSESLFSIR